MHILGHIFHAMGRELGASGEMFVGLDIVVFENAVKLNFVNGGKSHQGAGRERADGEELEY
jgi:hypothetical protein